MLLRRAALLGTSGDVLIALTHARSLLPSLLLIGAAFVALQVLASLQRVVSANLARRTTDWPTGRRLRPSAD